MVVVTARAMARQVRNAGRAGVVAVAISAVDVALRDLKARLLGVALSGLLGRARDAVRRVRQRHPARLSRPAGS